MVPMFTSGNVVCYFTCKYCFQGNLKKTLYKSKLRWVGAEKSERAEVKATQDIKLYHFQMRAVF